MDGHTQDPWTEAQWTQVQETVRDEARKQRVAASFLPVYGPLAPEEQTAKLQTLNVVGPLPQQQFQQVNDFDTRRLTSLSVNVGLRQAQVVEPDLDAALVAFRRAANLIARTEDRLVFRSQWGPGSPPGFPALAPCYITGGEAFDGLLETALILPQQIVVAGSPLNPTGTGLVRAVSRAISLLERRGHLGPFALVLGSLLFDVAHAPTWSLVLPADRIKPMLDGPLLRSSTLNRFNFLFQERTSGLVVSLADDLVDLVIANEISVRLLQVTTAASPRYIFRVSQRFALRVKQPTALVALV